MAPLVSICMIVKNEEGTLPRALANWRELAEELIVVDTGSTDNTVAIATEWGATVLHYDWQSPGHKGAARMVGIDAARGDWIVVLDADEVIDNPAVLRQILGDTGPAVGIYNVLFQNYGPDGQVALQWYQPRVFRRGSWQYVHREHEVPWPTVEDPGAGASCAVLFRHLPPEDRAVVKTGPMLERLKADVAERPDDPHSCYMLARQYALAGETELAQLQVAQYLQIAGPGHARLDACRLAAICCKAEDNMAGMYEWMHRGTAHGPGRRLLWIELAHMYHDDGNIPMALALARLAAALPLPPEQIEVHPVEQLTHICNFIESCQERR
jgi:hypothetical protein